MSTHHPSSLMPRQKCLARMVESNSHDVMAAGTSNACCCSLRLLCAGRLAPPPSVVGAWVRRSNGRGGGGKGRGEGHDATRHLHKIGPSDTPISSSSSPPPFLPLSGPGWPAWLESSGGVLHAGSQALAQVLTQALRYLDTYLPTQKTRSSASWPVQAQPGPSRTLQLPRPPRNSSSPPPTVAWPRYHAARPFR